MKNNYIVKFATGITVLALLAGCNGGGPKEPGKYAETAKCLTEKGVVMYGAFWCPHCNSQKAAFGEAVQYITYQECDEKGENSDRLACLQAGVTSYPTWIFPGQGHLIGAQPIFALAKLANCEDTLPEEDKKLLEESALTTEIVSASSAITEENNPQ